LQPATGNRQPATGYPKHPQYFPISHIIIETNPHKVLGSDGDIQTIADNVVPPEKVTRLQNRKLQGLYLAGLARTAIYSGVTCASVLGATLFELYAATLSTLAVALGYVRYVGFQHV
jgi:hypothetical protein